MALTVGELNAYLDVDKRGWDRGLADADRSLDGFTRDANGRLHDLEGKFVKEGEAAGRSFGTGLNKGGSKSSADFVAKIRSGLSSLSGVAASIGAISGKAAAIITLAQAAGSLVAALAPAAAGVLALPAALAVAGIAMGVFKLAVSGVGDALAAAASGDAKKLDKALKGLSPSARAFVKEFAKVAPELKRLQQATQETFFKPLVGEIRPLVEAWLPTLRRGLLTISATLNDGAQGLLKWARSASVVKDGGTVFAGVQKILSNLMGILRPAAQALLDLIVPALPLLARGSDELRDWVVAISGWTSEARKSGALTSMFKKVGDTFAQIGRIGRNVATIIANVFNAGGKGGAPGFLTILEKITAKLAQFSSTPAGQKLITLFAAIASAAGPVLWAVSAISTVISVIGTVAGAVLTPVGGVIAVIALLAAGMALLYLKIQPVRNAINETFRTIAPIVTTAVRTIVTWVRGQLIPALQNLATRAKPLIDALANGWRTKVLPAIRQVAQVYLTQLKPNLESISNTINTKVAPAITKLVAAYQKNKPQIDAFVSGLVKVGVAAAKVGFILGGTLFRALITLAGSAIGGVITGISLLVNAWGAMVRAATAVSTFLTVTLPAAFQRAVSVVTGFANAVLAPFRNAWQQMRQAASGGVAGIVSYLVQLPFRALAAVLNMAASLLGFFSTLWANARARFVAGIAAVVTLVAGLPGRAQSAASSLGSRLLGVVSSAWNTARTAFVSGVNQAVQAVTALPGRVVSALSSLPGRMRSIGGQIVSGLVSGITAGIGRVASAAGRLVSAIPAAAKKLLGISSPSKVMREAIGKQVPAGVIAGMDSGLGQVTRAAARMAGAAIVGTSPQPGLAAAAGFRPLSGRNGESAALIAELRALRGDLRDQDPTGRLEKALSRVQVRMDGREVGRLHGQKSRTAGWA